MEFLDPNKPGDGEQLQITRGDREVLEEIRESEDAGGGGHVSNPDLNDPDLQYPVWTSPS